MGLIVSLGILVLFILVEVDSLLEIARNDSATSLFPVKSRCEYTQIPENDSVVTLFSVKLVVNHSSF